MKILYKAAAAAIIIGLFFSLTGCWDAHELDTLAIVTGVGIDVIEGSDKLLFSLQIGKVEQASGGSGTKSQDQKPFILMQIEEQGLMYALKSLRNKTSRQLLLHHNQVLIISKELGEKGISHILDAFVREQQMRSEVWVIVADGRADELLSEEMDQDKISGLGISRLMDDSIKISQIYDVPMQRFLSNMISPTNQAIAPMIKLVKKENSTEFDLKGFAVFNGGKVVGEFGLDKARGFSWIKDYLKDLTLNLISDDGYATVSMTNFHTDLKADFTPEGKPLIKLELTSNFELIEIQGFKGWEMEKIASQLEEVANQMITDEVSSVVEYAQSLDSDIFAFGSEYHKRHQKKWKTMKENWSEHFADLTLEIKVDAIFLDEGKILDLLSNVKEKAKEG